MKKFRIIDRIIPLYSIMPLIVCVLLNSLVYWGARIITADWHHYDMTSAFDQWIPFVPISTIIYFGCYLFWVLNYVMIVRLGREETYRFLSADMTGKIICFLIFILIPTTNVRPQLFGDGVGMSLMRFLYRIDEADNLFPSIHCLVSWYSYIGIRGEKRISKKYRGFSMLMAFLVFFSTLTTRQHVIADVLAGWLIAEYTCRIVPHTVIYRYYQRFFSGLERRLFLNGK